ncbi:polysaccharide pyruvyl transferase family protein [Pseudorhodoferax soli]|uniref:Succinoglycan biosynthesis protein ExoV n=1 Tax=Pseudorhodoferax soli TaxID=545864 RepID=A0A368YCW3_9BURK|nr:polysaccharide pyruvyl transferase family protein [Pseudorhodoferax soli]RCW76034.1 succinoglycan biosynthesis protein ExoV [Pseudorhodoferax soli]
MEIVYYKDPKHNFGDDLNEVVWPQLFPAEMLDDPDIVLVGIGSVLTQQQLAPFAGTRRKVIVLGSGTSYGVPPQDMSGWHVLGVRGPLTAAVIERPEAAATDSAILLAALPQVVQRAEEAGKVLFMPHHRSIFSTPWRQMVEDLGMTYVTPQQPVRDILAQFAQARLVVTEAMHGAIVADTLRIPWVPLRISPAIEEFKWRDWCLSLGLTYAPVSIPAGTASDRDRFGHMRKLLLRTGVRGEADIPENAEAATLRAYLERRFSSANSELNFARQRRLVRLLRWPMRLADPLYTRGARLALASAAKGPCYLSRDADFARRLVQMQEAVEAAKRLAT